jgi:hypothetical protein
VLANNKLYDLEGYKNMHMFLPTPNPSQEGNKTPLADEQFPSWEGLGVDKKPDIMRFSK